MKPLVRPTKFFSLLPANVVVVEASDHMWEGGLYPEEEQLIAQAVSKRKREFTAGRNCARQALNLLGVAASPIPTGTCREPIFPAEISGAITHTAEYCAAAVAFKREIRSIGIDAEMNVPLKAGVGQLVLSVTERARLRLLHNESGCHFETLIFSGKEAFYKAFFGINRQRLDFLDVNMSILPDKRIFSIEIVNNEISTRLTRKKFFGAYHFDRHRIYTAMVLTE